MYLPFKYFFYNLCGILQTSLIFLFKFPKFLKEKKKEENEGKFEEIKF